MRALLLRIWGGAKKVGLFVRNLGLAAAAGIGTLRVRRMTSSGVLEIYPIRVEDLTLAVSLVFLATVAWFWCTLLGFGWLFNTVLLITAPFLLWGRYQTVADAWWAATWAPTPPPPPPAPPPAPAPAPISETQDPPAPISEDEEALAPTSENEETPAPAIAKAAPAPTTPRMGRAFANLEFV